MKEGTAGIAVIELCCKRGDSYATYCQWKGEYSGVQVSASYSDYVRWKLRMPSSNACMQFGAGECSDQARSNQAVGANQNAFIGRFNGLTGLRYLMRSFYLS